MTFPLSTACLADLVDGRLTDPGYGLEIVTGGCIDSRNVVAHDCFFALPGERTHGVLFAEQAIARGAACVVTDCIRSAVLPSPTDIVRPSLAALDSQRRTGASSAWRMLRSPCSLWDAGTVSSLMPLLSVLPEVLERRRRVK
jgi:UDP-N-acetylmuramyl pentapeptide synthase